MSDVSVDVVSMRNRRWLDSTLLRLIASYVLRRS